MNRALCRAHGTAHTTTPWRAQRTRGDSASTNANVVPRSSARHRRRPSPRSYPGTPTPTDTAAIPLPPDRPRGDHNLPLAADPDVLNHRPLQPKQPRPYPCPAHVASAPSDSSPQEAGTLEAERRAPPTAAYITHGNNRSARKELTRGLDLAPSLHGDDLKRLVLALDDLAAVRGDGQPIALEPAAVRGETAIELRTRGGEVKIVPEPAGTRGGYDDLRRAASREPLGRGLRPLVASIGDLARMAAALGREQDLTPLRQLRILADLDRGRVRGIER